LRRSRRIKSRLHRRASLALFGVREAFRFSAIKRQLGQLALEGNRYIQGRLPSPSKLVVENMIFSGAKKSRRVWLLDQGRFQFQGWIPKSVIHDRQRLCAYMADLVVFADVLVVFRCSAPLVVSRVQARGDLCARDALARSRGFSGLLEMSEYDYSLATEKVDAALAVGSDVVFIDIYSSNARPKVSVYHSLENNQDLSYLRVRRELLKQVTEDFRSWWVSV
jgi:hypothetical protein